MNNQDIWDMREKLIERIEGFAGTLKSVPYHQISTDDLKTILNALGISSHENRVFTCKVCRLRTLKPEEA